NFHAVRVLALDAVLTYHECHQLGSPVGAPVEGERKNHGILPAFFRVGSHLPFPRRLPPTLLRRSLVADHPPKSPPLRVGAGLPATRRRASPVPEVSRLLPFRI